LLVDVFNFEVFEDQSYIANGIVVHNCNDHATQDRYGLGAGVYPLTALPTLPAHPHCSCYFTVSFPNREESDRIIRARYGLFEEMA